MVCCSLQSLYIVIAVSSDFICGIYIGVFSPYLHFILFVYVAFGEYILFLVHMWQ